MPQRFADKTVLVTGAAGGLGRALALGFASEGASLIITDVATDGLEESAALLRETGAACDARPCDLADEAAIQAFAADTLAAQPKIDVLVNNAGIAYGAINQMIDAVDQADWLRFLSINSLAPLFLAKALRTGLAAQFHPVKAHRA